MYESYEFFRLQEAAAHRIAARVGVTSTAKRALEELKTRRDGVTVAFAKAF